MRQVSNKGTLVVQFMLSASRPGHFWWTIFINTPSKNRYITIITHHTYVWCVVSCVSVSISDGVPVGVSFGVSFGVSLAPGTTVCSEKAWAMALCIIVIHFLMSFVVWKAAGNARGKAFRAFELVNRPRVIINSWFSASDFSFCVCEQNRWKHARKGS